MPNATQLKEALQVAAEYGFQVEAIRADLSSGAITAQEVITRIMEEVYGDGGLAGY